VTVGAGGRRVVLCADDFGLTEAASISIAELASIAAISAASCVVDAPGFPQHVAKLAQCRGNVAIGLHLNLTAGARGQVRRPLASWIARAYSIGVPPRRELRAEIARQLDAFEDALNSAPCFVDGHQHVHQLPQIRDALMDEIVGRYGTSVMVRCTASMRPRGLKARVIARLGGTALRTMLATQHIPSNSDFAGVYNFSTARPFCPRLMDWLRTLPDGGLVMCHPERNTVPKSPRTAREAEHDFLASRSWSELRRALHITLIPFRAEAYSSARPHDSERRLPLSRRS
jgi:predicted glycoside hydrolase/deacetylase ChbG (UPF0249 family)